MRPVPFQFDPAPPTPTSASWDVGTRQVTVTFDMDIQSGLIDLTNWSLTHSGGSDNPTTFSIAGNVLTLQFEAYTGVTEIAYTPPPFDVVGTNGEAVQPFVMPL